MVSTSEERTVKQPLNEDDRREIRRLKMRLADLISLADRFERCGMPCEENQILGKRLGGYLDQLETEFFPDGPPE